MREPLARELLDLAARRPLAGAELPDGAVQQAFEHRIVGLLVTAVREGRARVSPEWERNLAAFDATTQLWHKKQLATMRNVSATLDEEGLPHLFEKGAVNAERWYRRPGERQSIDVDVVFSPHQMDRWLPAIAALAPEFARSLQGISPDVLLRELAIKLELAEGIDLDVHFDVIKFGVPCRQSEEIWARRQPFILSNGLEIAVLDPETALVAQLTELNRDRFCHLQGFAEIARIIRSEVIDWEYFDDFVMREGIREATFLSLRVVTDALQLPDPYPVALSGWRVSVWNAAWPRGHRLQGDIGALSWRHRERLLAFLPSGRRREAVGAVRRYFFPSASRLEALYPCERGPYLWRNIRLRFKHSRARRLAASEILESEATANRRSTR